MVPDIYGANVAVVDNWRMYLVVYCLVDQKEKNEQEGIRRKV